MLYNQLKADIALKMIGFDSVGYFYFARILVWPMTCLHIERYRIKRSAWVISGAEHHFEMILSNFSVLNKTHHPSQRIQTGRDKIYLPPRACSHSSTVFKKHSHDRFVIC